MIYPRELFTEQEWRVLGDDRVRKTTADCTLSDLQVEHGYESYQKFFAFVLFCRGHLDLWDCDRPKGETHRGEVGNMPGLWFATSDGAYVAEEELQKKVSGRHSCLDL